MQLNLVQHPNLFLEDLHSLNLTHHLLNIYDKLDMYHAKYINIKKTKIHIDKLKN